jgi:hypothetical protein
MLAPGDDLLEARKLGPTKVYGQSKLVRCTNNVPKLPDAHFF